MCAATSFTTSVVTATPRPHAGDHQRARPPPSLLRSRRRSHILTHQEGCRQGGNLLHYLGRGGEATSSRTRKAADKAATEEEHRERHNAARLRSLRDVRMRHTQRRTRSSLRDVEYGTGFGSSPTRTWRNRSALLQPLGGT
ncbi:hypothetical protein VPH35_089457 [Triticum aestivum]